MYPSLLSGITEPQQIEHSSWGNINITLQNQISFFFFFSGSNVYTSEWRRHQFSPDGPELLDLWFKNEIFPDAQLSDVSPWNLHDGGEMEPTCASAVFPCLLSVYPGVPFSLNPPPGRPPHPPFDVWSCTKTLTWQRFLARTASSLAAPRFLTFTSLCLPPAPRTGIIAPPCLRSRSNQSPGLSSVSWPHLGIMKVRSAGKWMCHIAQTWRAVSLPLVDK